MTAIYIITILGQLLYYCLSFSPRKKSCLLGVTEEEVYANPWKAYRNNYVEKDICFNKDWFYSQDKFLLKCDAYYINKFNEKHKGMDCEFILNQHPSTISGNSAIPQNHTRLCPQA